MCWIHDLELEVMKLESKPLQFYFLGSKIETRSGIRLRAKKPKSKPNLSSLKKKLKPN
jgi:hypothetical protein